MMEAVFSSVTLRHIPDDCILRSHGRQTLTELCNGELMSPVMYELGFYIPEDDILHSLCRENLRSYIELTAGLCSET
jgi:hypothetical protein